MRGDVVEAEGHVGIEHVFQLHAVDPHDVAHLHVPVAAAQLGALDEGVLAGQRFLPALEQHGAGGTGIESHAQFEAGNLHREHGDVADHVERRDLRRLAPLASCERLVITVEAVQREFTGRVVEVDLEALEHVEADDAGDLDADALFHVGEVGHQCPQFTDLDSAPAQLQVRGAEHVLHGATDTERQGMAQRPGVDAARCEAAAVQQGRLRAGIDQVIAGHAVDLGVDDDELLGERERYGDHGR